MAWETSIKPPPGLKSLASFNDWFSSNRGAMGAEWGAKFNPMEAAIGQKRTDYANWQNQWSGAKWAGSPWETQSTDYTKGMEDLAAKIRAGASPEDIEQAKAYAAQMAGMDPTEWNALLDNWNKRFEAGSTYAQDTDAAAVSRYQEQMANTPFAQEQAKADRVALAQMQAQMGKQLESIMGGRGGMGGFQAAYELTTQLQNTWLQKKNQDINAQLDRAFAAVNSNNEYYSALIQRGEMSAQNYLTLRSNELQNSFQNYTVMLDQLRKDFDLQYQVNEDERKRIDANFAAQIDQMTNQMYLEMGGDQQTVNEYLDALQTSLGQDFLARQAQMDALAESNKDTATKIGGGLVTAGVAVLAIPGGQIPGLLMIITGGIISIFGGLLTPGIDTRTPEQKAADFQQAQSDRER